MNKVLEAKFFEGSTLLVARDLLGKFLVTRLDGETLAAMIVEVEAYDGIFDKASHASRGLTPRTKVMFGQAGRYYVYPCLWVEDRDVKIKKVPDYKNPANWCFLCRKVGK